jgi:hypothetical protein
MSTHGLVDALRAIGFNARVESRVGGVAIDGYPVCIGRHAGDKVDVALAIDYPFTPPVGLHFRASYGTLGQNNVSQSALGADWQYWSRRYVEWRSDRSPRSVVAYINRILLDA